MELYVQIVAMMSMRTGNFYIGKDFYCWLWEQ